MIMGMRADTAGMGSNISSTVRVEGGRRGDKRGRGE
jgi:hypothetical protein